MAVVNGTDASEKVVARGDFQCPVERRESSYVVQQVVLEGEEIGEFVLCRSCGSEFAPKVLGPAESTEQTALHEAFSLLFSAMIIADKKIKESEMEKAQELLSRLDTPYDMDVLLDDARRVRGDLSDVLRDASRHLSLPNRRLLLVGAILIANADDELRVEERDLIANAGRHMGFTRQGIAELFDETLGTSH